MAPNSILLHVDGDGLGQHKCVPWSLSVTKCDKLYVNNDMGEYFRIFVSENRITMVVEGNSTRRRNKRILDCPFSLRITTHIQTHFGRIQML